MTAQMTSVEGGTSTRRPTLETMFSPRSVAVIGASETAGSVGRTLIENLHSYDGSVFPVNPKHSEILGQKAFRQIGDVPAGEPIQIEEIHDGDLLGWWSWSLPKMADHGLKRGEDGLEVYVMCEIPSNVILANEFADIFDGFSIGSNDLTQLILAVDRDSEIVAGIFDERNPAVMKMIADVIAVCRAKKSQ